MSDPRSRATRGVMTRDELVVLTADDQGALAVLVRDAAEHAPADGTRPLRDWAAALTAVHGGGRLALAVIGSTCAQVSDKLRHAAARLADPDCVRINDRSGIFYTANPLHPSGGRVALLFPGEGAQYPGMLADLCMRFSEARQAFDRADRAFENHPRQLVPSQIAFGDTKGDRLWDMDCAVEMVFSGNAAVHAVLDTVGFAPDVVVGHSTGDYSALFASGAMRVKDDADMVRLMLGLNAFYEKLATADHMPERGLLAVGAGDADLIRNVLVLVPGLDLAMDNCPHQKVLCGKPEAIASAREHLAGHGAVIEELAFRRGYHTDAFRPALSILEPFFETLPLQKPAIELWSAATAARVPEDIDAFRHLALEQWALPVRFTETVERLWDEGVRIFVESGPRSNLTGFVKDTLRERQHLAVSCDGLHRSTVTQLLFALGQLAAHRVPLNLARLGQPQLPPPRVRSALKTTKRPGPVLTLATGWPEVRLSAATASRFIRQPEVREAEPSNAPTPAPVPAQQVAAPVAVQARQTDPRSELVAAHFGVARRAIQAQERILVTFLNGGQAQSAVSPPSAVPAARLLSGARIRQEADTLMASVTLSLEQQPFLADHSLGGPVSDSEPTLTGLAVMPFTMTLELAAEAALSLAPGTVCIGFEDVMALRWIALQGGKPAEIEVRARCSPPKAGAPVKVSVEIAGAAEPRDVYFTAIVLVDASYPHAPAMRPITVAGPSRWDRPRIYRDAMFHGPLFQGIERLTRLDDDGADATLEILSRTGLLSYGESAFAVDPVLLDQPGQVVGVWTAERLTSGFVVFPTRLARLDLFSPPMAAGSRVQMRASIRLLGESSVRSDLEVDDGAGRLHARFVGWEDKRFDVPASFLAFMLDPRHASLCRPATTATATRPASATAVCVARTDLPSGFSVRGGIWQQVLAGLILGSRERDAWQTPAIAAADAGRWLLGRLAAKDAVRRWLATQGLAVAPADIVITDEASGSVRASGGWSTTVGAEAEVSVVAIHDEVIAEVLARVPNGAAGRPASAQSIR